MPMLSVWFDLIGTDVLAGKVLAVYAGVSRRGVGNDYEL